MDVGKFLKQEKCGFDNYKVSSFKCYCVTPFHFAMKYRSVVLLVNLLVLITILKGDKKRNATSTRYTGRLIQFFFNFMVDGGGDLVS